MEDLLKDALEKTYAALAKFDIDDTFTVKVKRFPKKSAGALALYRSRSQFRKGPIFWVNEDFERKCDLAFVDACPELVLTLLHEYGHVIYEFADVRARFFDPTLKESIVTIAEDEEDFAETFAVVVRKDAASPAYRAIIARYMLLLRGAR